MMHELRKYHIEASNKCRPDHQSYVNQYGSKGPTNDHQNHKINQKMGGTTQEDNKNNDDNKKDK